MSIGIGRATFCSSRPTGHHVDGVRADLGEVEDVGERDPRPLGVADRALAPRELGGSTALPSTRSYWTRALGALKPVDLRP